MKKGPIRHPLAGGSVFRSLCSVLVGAAAFLLLLTQRGLSAELMFDVGLKQMYEDNLSDAADRSTSEGDRSTTLFAALGGFSEISSTNTYVVVRAILEGYEYRTFDALDGMAGGLQIGIYSHWSEVFSSQVLVRGHWKDYRDNQRDSTSGVAGISLAQHLSERLWIRESLEYEKNGARTDFFSYSGTSAAVQIGLTAASRLFLALGGAFVRKSYEDVSAYRSDAWIANVVAEYRLVNRLMAGMLYEQQRYETQSPSARYYNTLTSLSLTYSY